MHSKNYLRKRKNNMVTQERKKSRVKFIPECTCNKKLALVHKSASRSDDNLDKLNSWAEDHEELHTLSHAIVDFIAKTGKMQKEDIIRNFPEYNEGMLSMAANLSMYPIIFPKRRHAPLTEFVQLTKRAHQLTDEFRRLKYATDYDTRSKTTDNK